MKIIGMSKTNHTHVSVVFDLLLLCVRRSTACRAETLFECHL